MGESSRDSVPLFVKLVKVVFPVPAASSKSERVFSVAGNVVTPRGPTKGGGSRGGQVQLKVAKEHGLHQNVICHLLD